MLRSGTTIDASFSASNAAKAPDPGMSSAEKRNGWSFGLQSHIGLAVDGRVTHNLDTTTAMVQGVRVRDELLHGSETSSWAGKGRDSAKGEVLGVARRGPKHHPEDEMLNWIIPMEGARVMQPLRVLERQFDHVKTRSRGFSKTRAELFTLFAPVNLFPARRRLIT